MRRRSEPAGPACGTRPTGALAETQAAFYMLAMGQLGRMLLLFSALLAVAGVVLILGDKLGLGRLPGDLVWKRKGTTVYFPIVTSILVSVVLTVLANLLLRRK
jgi:Protein of unknown function (DUF2905)